MARSGAKNVAAVSALKEPIGASTRAEDTRRPDCLNYGWPPPASLSGGPGRWRGGSRTPGDHTRLIIRATSGPLKPPRGEEAVRRARERPSGVGDAKITTGVGGLGARSPWEIFENDCPECHSRSRRRRRRMSGVRRLCETSEKRHLRAYEPVPLLDATAAERTPSRLPRENQDFVAVNLHGRGFRPNYWICEINYAITVVLVR